MGKLDTYLDGELSAEEMRALDAHVRGCPSCAAETLARVQFKRSVQAAGRKFTANPDFQLRVRRSIAPARKRSGALAWKLATAAALALAIVAGVLGYARFERLRQERIYGELADLHVVTLASSNPVDVISSDRHTVKPWFQGRIPFTFSLPELQGSDFTLLGGRVTYLEQVPGAHLLYQVRKHQISVFIFPARMLPDEVRDAVARRHASFNTDSWVADGLRYFVVGDAAPEDLQKLSALLKSAAR
jgi:anti-sigma factor RsiW